MYETLTDMHQFMEDLRAVEVCEEQLKEINELLDSVIDEKSIGWFDHERFMNNLKYVYEMTPASKPARMEMYIPVTRDFMIKILKGASEEWLNLYREMNERLKQNPYYETWKELQDER